MAEGSTEKPRRLKLVVALFEGGLAVTALAFGCLLKRPVWEQLAGAPRDFGYGLLATAPLALFLWLAIRRPVGPLKSLMELTTGVVMPLFVGYTLAELALVACLAGLGEEMFFRGLVQEAIAEHAGPWLGLAIASVVFGLLHALSITYAALATAIGLFLGAICLATGNLVAAIVAHAAYDFLALWYLLRVHAAKSEGAR
jgi:uncharacterized protein